MDCDLKRQIAESIGISYDEFEGLLNTRMSGKFCIHCKRRMHNGKGQYCIMRPSSRSMSGFMTVKAHDDACGLYKERRFV